MWPVEIKFRALDSDNFSKHSKKEAKHAHRRADDLQYYDSKLNRVYAKQTYKTLWPNSALRNELEAPHMHNIDYFDKDNYLISFAVHKNEIVSLLVLVKQSFKHGNLLKQWYDQRGFVCNFNECYYVSSFMSIRRRGFGKKLFERTVRRILDSNGLVFHSANSSSKVQSAYWNYMPDKVMLLSHTSKAILPFAYRDFVETSYKWIKENIKEDTDYLPKHGEIFYEYMIWVNVISK